MQAADDGVACPIPGALLEAAGLASLTDERTAVIWAGIAEVEVILENGGLDSNKTTVLSELLGREGVDPAVAECFLDDGKWDPDQRQFQGAPVWDCVRTALENLKTVLEENIAGPESGGVEEGMQDAGAAAVVPVAPVADEQPMGNRTNCARSVKAVGWDAILPRRGPSLENQFEQFRELHLGDVSVSGEDEKREWLKAKYREHFVLKGGGCIRRRGGKASDCENSFHVTYVDPAGKSGSCCDGPNNLRKWMLSCLKGPASRGDAFRGAKAAMDDEMEEGDAEENRTGPASSKKRKPSVSGGGSPRKARKAADGGRAEEPDPLLHTEPVLNPGEYVIEVQGLGNCMFEAAGTGIKANLGHARPVGEALRLALANETRAKAVSQVTSNLNLRKVFEEFIRNQSLVDDAGNMITNIDDHAATMATPGIYGAEMELYGIAAANHLVIHVIRGVHRSSYQMAGQEILNPSITLAFYGIHYNLVVNAQTEMGRRMAEADQAEVAAAMSEECAIFASGAAARSMKEAEKAACEVRERTPFLREVARASEFGKKPKIIEVGPNSLRAALQDQGRDPRLKLSSEQMKMLQDAGATREAVSEWLAVKGNRSKAFSSSKAASATAWMKQSATAKSVQSKAGGADALRDLAAKLLESETFLGHAIHLFALAHLLGVTIAILTYGRGGGAKKPWVIWNSPSSAEPGAKKPRLYLSRHGDNFASLQDLIPLEALTDDE
ncbi:hypothetical protein T484DRAFT_1890017, partial [Baffinella frigidus]